MEWHIGEYDPVAGFTYSDLGSGNVSFINNSLNGITYLWLFGDGETSELLNPTHTYEEQGDYMVKLFAGNCGMVDSTEQIVPIILSGIKDQNTSIGRVYPNPVSTSFTLLTNTPHKNSMYRVFDDNGRIVMTGKINSEQTNIDLKDFPTGVYLIKTEDGLNHSVKVVKK